MGTAQGMGYVFPATLTSVTDGNVNDVFICFCGFCHPQI